MKMVCLILVAGAIVALAGCGGNPSSATTPASGNTFTLTGSAS